jgi:hypothetical protein
VSIFLFVFFSYRSTVSCASDVCHVEVMQGQDFMAVIQSSPNMAASLRNMCRKRLFKKAIKQYSVKLGQGYSDDDLLKAFYDADMDRSGALTLNELKRLMHQMDPNYPLEEIEALLTFVDVDGDGKINLDEFKSLFRQFEEEAKKV